MSVVVVGSVAFDSLETPFGKREQALGGSANYFSISSSFFTTVRLCAVVGDDFPADHVAWLNDKGIDTSGLERSAGKTFHWKGRYGFDLNEAQTLDTQLNVFAGFDPILPDAYKGADTVFLANIHPALQWKVLEQVKQPRLVALDSMNFWIQGERAALQKVLKRVDVCFVNDGEARLLSGQHNIVRAARAIQAMGPRNVVVKRGEYGALLFRGEHVFFTPALPLEDVFDPTGAGDTFAGGFLGWLDRHGAGATDVAWKQAMVMGTVMASFVVEDFSFDRMRRLNRDQIAARWKAMHGLSSFHDAIDLA